MDEVRRAMRLVQLVAVLLALALGTMSANLLGVSDHVVLPDSQVRTLDESFGQVAARVPGFGGMFLDGDTLRVYLTNPSQKASAVRSVSAVFGAERIPVGGLQVLQATYGFMELSQWHDRMGVLFHITGVMMTDIDESTNRLKVGVVGSVYFGAVEGELARLDIPRPAVDIVEMEPIVFAATLRDRIRPIEGGIQIAFSTFLCTLGFNGVRSGVSGFVVNSHCTNIQGGVDATQHYQPTVAGGNFIGTEIADPLYTTGKCPPGTKGKVVCRFSDSAYDRRDAAVTADLGFVARPGSVNTGSLTIAGQFRIVSEGPSLKGQVVNKVGRTTGWTQGTVTDTCVNVRVSGSKIMQVCQDIVSAGVGGGDSGSPVFAITSGDDVQLRGILWGGIGGKSFVYSPIANIERTDELGPITTCAPTFAC